MVFRVKRIHFMWAVLSYIGAALPIIVLLVSPNPGLGGWIAFGSLALGFAAISTAYLAHVLRAHVSIDGTLLRYQEPWRSVEVDLGGVKGVYLSLNYIVLDVGKPRRVAIPDVFERRHALLDAIAQAAQSMKALKPDSG